MDFIRCKYCQINHDRGVAHLYSQSHKKILRYILKKYKIKIKSSKSELKQPVIKTTSWERGKKFWCHFCEENLPLHLLLDEATVANWTLLKHLTGEDHEKNVELFWKKQRIRDQNSESYCLSKEIFAEYEHLSAIKVRDYIAEKANQLKQKADVLRRKEEERKQLASKVHNGKEITDYMNPHCHKRTTREENNVMSRGFRTVAAKAEGLTCISIPSDKKFKGNMYSGMIPPWEMKDSGLDPSTSQVIGPSEADYEKHLEYERKRKLPACRVGAKVQDSGGGANWMPSFGRVWSKNTRQHQRKWLSRQQNKGPAYKRANIGAHLSNNNTTQQSYSKSRQETAKVNDRPCDSSLGKTTNYIYNISSSSNVNTPDSQLIGAQSRGYVRKKSSNSIGIGKIKIAENLL